MSATWIACSTPTAEHRRPMQDYVRAQFPKHADDSDLVYRQAVKAKAFDALRGLLPAAAVSNVGIYGTGQAYEALLLRMRSHALPEARYYADLMLTELRKVIPSFLERVDREDRGVVWSDYFESTREETAELVEVLFPEGTLPTQPRWCGSSISTRCRDQDGRVDDVSVLAPARRSDRAARRRDGSRGSARVVRAYVGERQNRRHKPGRALERPFYRFDVLCDYGAFRDLQRHRMMTIDWQQLCPYHGYTKPD